MKKFFYLFFLFIIAIFIYIKPVFAEKIYPAAFLENALNSRSAGMGGTFHAAPEDIQAIITNPSGLALGDKQIISFSGFHLFEIDYTLINMRYIIQEWDLLKDIGIGFAYFKADTSGIEETTYNPGSGKVESTGNTFGYKGDAYYLSIAKTFFTNISIGASYKMILESLDSYKGYGAGIDLGCYYQYSDEIGFGISAINFIAPEIEWNTPSSSKEKLPLTIIYGTGIQLRDDTKVSLDIHYIKDESSTIHLGLEHWYHEKFPIRLGIDHKSLSLGTGIQLNDIKMDIAWTSRMDRYFEDIYRFSIGYEWL